jgi:hypothetical protein
VEYFNYLVSIVTNDATCTREIECRVAMAKEESNKKEDSFHEKIELKFRE